MISEGSCDTGVMAAENSALPSEEKIMSKYTQILLLIFFIYLFLFHNIAGLL